MATQTKKAATKKAAPKKAAKKSAAKKSATATAAVSRNATASAAVAKDGSSKAASKKKDEPVKLSKEEQFEQLGVPKEKRGENLHEQNPDLQTAISRQNLISQQDTQKKAQETTVTGTRKSEEEK